MASNPALESTSWTEALGDALLLKCITARVTDAERHSVAHRESLLPFGVVRQQE